MNLRPICETQKSSRVLINLHHDSSLPFDWFDLKRTYEAETENEWRCVSVLLDLGGGSDCCLRVLIRLLSVQIAASAQAPATGMPLADRCSRSSMCLAERMISLPVRRMPSSHTAKINPQQRVCQSCVEFIFYLKEATVWQLYGAAISCRMFSISFVADSLDVNDH